MKIDFLTISTMEVWHYQSIVRALCARGVDARCISPGLDLHSNQIGWDDPWRIDKLLRTLKLPYWKSRRHDAQCVITTQNYGFVQDYPCKKGRMMYGVGLVRPKEQMVDERPMDFHLVHGPLGVKQQFSDHALYSPSLPPEKVAVIGYPKLDGYWSLEQTRQDRITILYMPTWGERSSIEEHALKLVQKYRKDWLIIKPHHCTIQHEYQRMELLQSFRRGTGMVDLCLDDVPIEGLYRQADHVLTDVSSGAFPEALLIGKALEPLGDRSELVVENLDPKFLFSTTKGQDGEVAAEAILEFICSTQ